MTVQRRLCMYTGMSTCSISLPDDAELWIKSSLQLTLQLKTVGKIMVASVKEKVVSHDLVKQMIL